MPEQDKAKDVPVQTPEERAAIAAVAMVSFGVPEIHAATVGAIILSHIQAAEAAMKERIAQHFDQAAEKDRNEWWPPVVIAQTIRSL
jgi:hypothetical protein